MKFLTVEDDILYFLRNEVRSFGRPRLEDIAYGINEETDVVRNALDNIIKNMPDAVDVGIVNNMKRYSSHKTRLFGITEYSQHIGLSL